MTPAQDTIRARIAATQDHVLAAVSGLDPDSLLAPAAASGWSMARMLMHLTYDDEVFWVHAILAGDADGIAAVRDGWAADADDPVAAVELYRRTAERSRVLLAAADLDAPPAWWPPADVFPFPAYENGWQVAVHLLTEIATHAGHLDMAREAIDGHQHLVVD